MHAKTCGACTEARRVMPASPSRSGQSTRLSHRAVTVPTTAQRIVTSSLELQLQRSRHLEHVFTGRKCVRHVNGHVAKQLARQIALPCTG